MRPWQLEQQNAVMLHQSGIELGDAQKLFQGIAGGEGNDDGADSGHWCAGPVPPVRTAGELRAGAAVNDNVLGFFDYPRDKV